MISLKVKKFTHYEFLHHCLEFYVKERNPEVIYDELYEDIRDTRVSVVSYYADEMAEDDDRDEGDAGQRRSAKNDESTAEAYYVTNSV